MIEPSPESSDGGLHGLRAGNLVIVNDSRSNAAGTQAARRQQRYLAVRRRLAGLDMRLLLQCREDLASSLDVAGRPQADDAAVFTLGLEGEKVIERGNAVHPA